MTQDWETLPGETPIDDISGLIPKGIATREQLNLLEGENVLKAIEKYLAAKPSRRLAPFTFSWCLKLHQEMFGEVWNWAGQPRQEDLNLGVSWCQIQPQLKNLVDDLEYWEENWPDVLEQAVHLHYRSVSIHPFKNGNGRWSRMLSNIWLKRHGSPVVEWPDTITGKVSVIRGEYIAAIKKADQGDMSPLIELHRRFIETSEAEDNEI